MREDTGGQPALRALAQAKGLRIGAAVSAGPLRDDPAYRDIIAREFNALTCENAMKFGPLRPSRDTFAFEEADAIVAFAEKHGMAVRGHTLVWHNQLPPWLAEECRTCDVAVDVVRAHIHTVVDRYQGKVFAWDVVNEAVDSSGKWRDSVFLRAFGPDYVKMAFHWAHEADPEAKLFYNDFSADGLNRKSNAIYRLLEDLVRQGVPVQGVGLQMHTTQRDPPDPHSVAANIRRFADLGLEVHITEMDVRLEEPVSEADLEDQARIYGDILAVCLEAEHCDVLVVWGVTDRYSWLPQVFPGAAAPLLFDDNGKPKPAYHALREALG